VDLKQEKADFLKDIMAAKENGVDQINQIYKITDPETLNFLVNFVESYKIMREKIT
jgi:predicted choloylglycine hydrolase